MLLSLKVFIVYSTNLLENIGKTLGIASINSTLNLLASSGYHLETEREREREDEFLSKSHESNVQLAKIEKNQQASNKSQWSLSNRNESFRRRACRIESKASFLPRLPTTFVP